jgi:hypothetical protein
VTYNGIHEIDRDPQGTALSILLPCLCGIYECLNPFKFIAKMYPGTEFPWHPKPASTLDKLMIGCTLS